MIRPTSEPLAIRMTSGLPFGASATTCTVTQRIRRGKLGAIERGHILTRQNQRNWMVFRLQRDAPSDGRLIGIARTNDREARDRTQAGELFDRLMGGSVLSQSNAVVGENNLANGTRLSRNNSAARPGGFRGI